MFRLILFQVLNTVLFVLTCSSVFTQHTIPVAHLFTDEEQSWIKKHPRIHFGYDPNWPPYEIYENGNYSGIAGDYVKIIEQKTGIDLIPLKNMTWSKSYEKLKKGEIKMVPSAGITEDRNTFLVFSEYYLEDPLVIATRKDFQFIGGLNDLIHHKIAVPANYFSTEIIRKQYPQIEIIEEENVEQCLKDVATGKADACVENLGVISYYMNNKGFTTLKIAAPTDIDNNGIAFAVTKDWAIFRDIINKVLRSMPQKQKTELRNNWISVRYEHGIDSEVIFYYCLLAVVVFLGIFFVIYRWNKSLRKQIKLRLLSERKLSHSLLEIQKQNDEKKILLQEIHHRVKNNLQIITSMLRLQASKYDNEDVSGALNDAVERIKSISLIHEKIYTNPSLTDVSLNEYIHSLCRELLKTFTQNKDKTVIFNLESNDIKLNLKQIIPLALIINELITNSLKYAFLQQEEGSIQMKFELEDQDLKFHYQDNGTWIDSVKGIGFGSFLIEIFTEQLNGTFTRSTEHGANYEFLFSDYESNSNVN